MTSGESSDGGRRDWELTAHVTSVEFVGDIGEGTASAVVGSLFLELATLDFWWLHVVELVHCSVLNASTVLLVEVSQDEVHKTCVAVLVVVV